MRLTKSFCLALCCFFLFSPLLLLAQHGIAEPNANPHGHGIMIEILEWVEFIVDMVGIGILVLGFVKGCFVFLKMEYDNMMGSDTFDDILALRSTLGGYIILALDFLIISDIIHSVIKPEFNELINLGIIVVLRTSIGFFLGRELMELRHEHAAAENEEGSTDLPPTA